MPKRITLLRRREDRREAAFGEYWSTTHAGIARGLPGVLRYLQNHVVAGAECGVDGIVELWFEDANAAMAGYASEVADRLAADEPNFLAGLTGCAYAGPGPDRPGALSPWKVWCFGAATQAGAEPGAGDRIAELEAWAAAAASAATVPGSVAVAPPGSVAVDLRDRTAPLLRRERLQPIAALPDLAVSIGVPGRAEAERLAAQLPTSAPPGLRLDHVLISRTVRIV